MKIVECVPNFSEGRDQKVLDAIADAIRAVKDAVLLDVDPGADTNRTVFTFVGSPEVVVEAAFQGIKKAGELIDMTQHHGEHPRMGATDVCPFVPVSGVTMEDCAELARQLGKRVGDELGIPVYLYENAASKPEWRNLAEVRKGEYEALPEKAKDPNWKPDFGPHVFNPRSGATAIGAREFLIAYNINLNTRDKEKAHDLALTIRESGRVKRDAAGKMLKDANGEKLMEPGLFQFCKAVGWYIEGFQRAQISINLTNYKVTPPHLVLEKVRELAWEKGIQVTGSELVGLIPKAALLEAGRYYVGKLSESAGVPERRVLETAVQSMGLRDLGPFDLDKKVIEYCIDRPEALVKLTVAGFIDELSSDSPAPGGGSVAGVCAAMSGALSAMVSNLTINKKGYESAWEEAKQTALEGQRIKEESLQLIDRDTDAFNQMMDALRLPKKTDAETATRNIAVEKATQNAILIPLQTLRSSVEGIRLAKQVAAIGNKNALSDAGVAGLTGLAAAKAAYFNILINMPGVSDAGFRETVLNEARALVAEGSALCAEVEKSVEAAL
jgi:glutamate formiminotransferase / formiminotetrahydrofolate cyclodeaminase